MPEYVPDWELVPPASDPPTRADYNRLHGVIPMYARRAMCRDAAVRWLWTHPKYEFIRMYMETYVGPPLVVWQVRQRGSIDPLWQAHAEGGQEIPCDQALYAACEAVLDAR